MKHRNFVKKYKTQLGITLVLLLVVMNIPFNSYYERTFEASELEIMPEAASITALVEEEVTALIVEGGRL